MTFNSILKAIKPCRELISDLLMRSKKQNPYLNLRRPTRPRLGPKRFNTESVVTSSESNKAGVAKIKRELDQNLTYSGISSRDVDQ